MRFFVGLHHPSVAFRFHSAFISVNAIRARKGPFPANDWIMDSGAFSEISNHGKYRHEVAEYANQIDRWKGNGKMLAAVSQDYMCEPFILAKTGLKVSEHQEMTITRYDELLRYDPEPYIMPVLQGYAAGEYADHLKMYGTRLVDSAWVGVGSVCKRNANPLSVLRVLMSIKHHRPDLRLHGFGLKMTAIKFKPIRELLHSADSMAWSFHARKQGRNANCWTEAMRMVDRVERTVRGEFD